MEIICLILAFLTFLIGFLLILYIADVIWKKTFKKLGHPIIIPRLPFMLFPEYGFWKQSIKPQYKNKFEIWIKEFKKNRKKYSFYLILGWLLIFIGIVGMVLIF
jgi:hypothetical protein